MSWLGPRPSSPVDRLFSLLSEDSSHSADEMCVESPSVSPTSSSPRLDSAFPLSLHCLNDTEVKEYFEFLSLSFSGVTWVEPCCFQEGVLNVNFLRALSNKENKRKHYEEAKVIFCPICIYSHWYLLILEKKDFGYRLMCLDGFNTFGQHPSLIAEGIRLLQAIYEDGCYIQKGSLAIPQQDNHVDCGVAISFYANQICQRLARGLEIESDTFYLSKERSYSGFRLEMRNAYESVAEYYHKEKTQRLYVNSNNPYSTIPSSIAEAPLFVIEDIDSSEVPERPERNRYSSNRRGTC